MHSCEMAFYIHKGALGNRYGCIKVGWWISIGLMDASVGVLYDLV